MKMKMKKKLFSCILLAVFACVALFSFAACSSDQNVSDRLDAMESDIDALEAKVEALEAANANFQQQLAALDTSSDTFADDLEKLTSNYNSLTASVQNATHIERVVVTEDDIGENNYITRCSFSTAVIDNKLSVGCVIYYNASLFKYQLATCKVAVSINSEIFDVGIYMTRTDAITETPSIRTTYQTEISVNNAEDIEQTVLKEIILYRFN